MMVEQVVEVFDVIFQVVDCLCILVDVGFGYVKFGQLVLIFLGGEVQWVKLVMELLWWVIGKIFYLIDEFMIGFSFYDVYKLMDVMQWLVDKGNLIICIEYNFDVICCSDWIIDFGFEGGDKGGEILVIGILEEVVQYFISYIGCYLV